MWARYKESGALTGLAFVDAGRRKAELLAGALIRGPRVAHTKFGPFFGFKPVPDGTPCIPLKACEKGDSVRVLNRSLVRPLTLNESHWMVAGQAPPRARCRAPGPLYPPHYKQYLRKRGQQTALR